jgi:hypothetical protein
MPVHIRKNGVVFKDEFNPEGVGELLDRRMNAVKDLNYWSVEVMKLIKEFNEFNEKSMEAKEKERGAWESFHYLTQLIRILFS